MATDASLSPGSVFADRWRLVHPLAAGGMSVVWVAEHVSLEGSVAIKLLHVHDALEQREERVVRFQREGRIAAALAKRSRHIVPVLDLGWIEPWAYLVTELVEEGTLDDAIFRAPIEPSNVRIIVSHVAKALAVAHDAGIVHRDVKTSNIALGLDEEGRPFARLFDFGVAKDLVARRSGVSTARGVVLGTPNTMSPEQARGLAIDGRADVWGLACVAWEALTAVPVATGESPEDIVARVCAFDIAPLRAGTNQPPAVMAVFRRAFARDLEHRFADAPSFAAALDDALPRQRAEDGRSRRRRIAAVGDVPTDPPERSRNRKR